MKKINEVSTEVLRKYIYNLERLDDLTVKLMTLNKEVKRLQEENNIIENTGKLPKFCEDDTQF